MLLTDKITDEQRTNIARWLESATLDVRAAKILHQNNLYAPAVYHAQQTYEKLYKALHLLLGHEEEYLKKKGHLYLTEKRLKAVKKNGIVSGDAELIAILEKHVPSYDTYSKNELELVKAGQESYMLVELARAMIFEDVSVIADKKIQEETKKWLQMHSAIFEERQFKIRELRLFFIFMGVMMLAHLLAPHCKYTRYPSKSFAPQDYNQKMGIVETLPTILDTADYAISEIRMILLKDSA